MTSSAQAMWRVRRAHSFSHAPAAGVSSGFQASSMATNARPAHGPALAAVAGDVLGAAALRRRGR